LPGDQRTLLETRGSRSLSSQTLVDLRTSRIISIGAATRIELLLDVFNLLELSHFAFNTFRQFRCRPCWQTTVTSSGKAVKDKLLCRVSSISRIFRSTFASSLRKIKRLTN
jgi:hypothetical protein